ncbi:MAG: hypothetical protein COT11_01015 [Candidatus Infernicultor aquiphilus]|nr:MAG: hypothetical protein COT11_01015 [Candidatus Atribacteria bacterium CG08_land_8_20_14_0_20_33_29]
MAKKIIKKIKKNTKFAFNLFLCIYITLSFLIYYSFLKSQKNLPKEFILIYSTLFLKILFFNKNIFDLFLLFHFCTKFF